MDMVVRVGNEVARFALPAALEELARCAGSQFDPTVVEALTTVLTTAPAVRAA